MNAVYMKRMEDLDTQLKRIRGQIDTTKKEWVETHCPVKVGDIVTVNGYSFRGKKMVVKGVIVKDSSFCQRTNWQWYAIGNVIKADGTEGANRAEWSQPVED